MDVLIVEPLEPEILQWIDARHPVRFAPELERDPRALRRAMSKVRALIEFLTARFSPAAPWDRDLPV